MNNSSDHCTAMDTGSEANPPCTGGDDETTHMVSDPDRVINVLAPPAMTFFDRITRMDEFFPVMDLEKVRGAHSEYVDALGRLTFNEKALMSSATIERNEMYHDVYHQLQKLESEIVKGAIMNGVSPAFSRARFLEEIEDAITRDHRFHELQSQLLKLRIQRYRVEAIVNHPNLKMSNVEDEGDADSNENPQAAVGTNS